jgi:hypothetical protein
MKLAQLAKVVFVMTAASRDPRAAILQTRQNSGIAVPMLIDHPYENAEGGAKALSQLRLKCVDASSSIRPIATASGTPRPAISLPRFRASVKFTDFSCSDSPRLV